MMMGATFTIAPLLLGFGATDNNLTTWPSGDVEDVR